MKIGVISTMSGFVWGGSEELWAAMVREALGQGHQAAVSVYRFRAVAQQMKELERRGARVLTRPMPRDEGLKAKVNRLWNPPFRDLEAFGPEVLCITQGGTFDAVQEFWSYLRFMIERYSIPYIVISQFNDDRFLLDEGTRRVASEFFGRARKILFVSAHNRLTAERQLARSLPGAEVVRNPYNLEDTSPVPWPCAERTWIACVARLDVWAKGQDLLFEAFSSEDWVKRDWRLRLYGEGGDLRYLKALADHFRISGYVDFKGQAADIRDVWAENHLLVLPSRAEGTPLVLVEGMLCGRPAVVTDVGDNALWIEDGRTGFIAASPTARSIGAALERAWKTRGEWKRMGKNAHAVAQERIDPESGRTLLRLVVAAGSRP